MTRYAVLSKANEVINIILTDNKEQSEIDLNCSLADADAANGAVFGWVWDGERYNPPTPPAEMLEELAEEPAAE